MDQKHRSHKHMEERGRRAKPSDEHHQRRHHGTEREQADEPRETRTQSRNHRIPINPSGNGLGIQLSGDNDYVQRWLVGTEVASTPNTLPDHVESRPKQTVPRSKHDLENDEEPRASKKRKRKHHSSSDSSLIDAPIVPRKQKRLPHGRYVEQPRRQNRQLPPAEEQIIESSEDESASTISQASSVHKQEIFEKRARHKTHEDRYETKKKDKRVKDSEQKKPKTRREKKEDRKKAPKKAGEDLMRNFSSKSVGQDRLTIRPSSGLGLFKNGRASSPAKRRGLPDLAFSEMDFLSRPNRIQPIQKEEQIKSKTREKEKRKASRAHEEISDFFKPKQGALQEIDVNRAHRLPSTTLRNGTLNPKVQADLSWVRSSSRYRQLSPSGPSHTGFGVSGASSERRTSSHKHRSDSYLQENEPESASRLSRASTSYVSWSESQLSRHKIPRGEADVGSRESPIPDAIRRSLVETGIFKDTGIYADSEHSPQAGQPLSGNLLSSRRPHTQGEYNQGSSIIQKSSRRGTPRTGRINNSEAFTRTLSQLKKPGDQEQGACPEEPELPQDVTGSTQAVDRVSADRNELATKHFGPQSGWHEDPSSRGLSRLASAGTMSKGISQEPSTTISREEIAKHARIKRPSTVPVVKSRENGRSSNLDEVVNTSNQEEDFVQQQRLTKNEEARRAQTLEPNPASSHKELAAGDGPPQALAIATNSSLQSQSEAIARPTSSKGEQLQQVNGFTTGQLSPPKLDSVPQEANSVQRDYSTTYLGLPLRGGAWKSKPTPQIPQYSPPAFMSNSTYQLPALHTITDLEQDNRPLEDNGNLQSPWNEEYDVVNREAYSDVLTDPSVGEGVSDELQGRFSADDHRAVYHHSPKYYTRPGQWDLQNQYYDEEPEEYETLAGSEQLQTNFQLQQEESVEHFAEDDYDVNYPNPDIYDLAPEQLREDTEEFTYDAPFNESGHVVTGYQAD